MKRLLISLSLLLMLGTMIPTNLSAQYYSWGTDPTSFRWRHMRADQYRVIYPDTAQNIANQMMLYLDAVRNDIDYGYRHPQMSIPFVVHPANFQSNGLVMWMPRRVEFISTPATRGYSMPWTKQLIAHEYRHAVQYNNLNRGVVKALSYVLGQQSSTIGLLFMPLWMMEGDAVMTETEMSTFGRGLQPSFTMAFRAYGDDLSKVKNVDRWICGSYKDYIPDHYSLGYLISRHGYSAFGRVMGDDVAWISARRPYMVVSTAWTLKKLYGVSKSQLIYDTFDELNAHWNSLPKVKQTTEAIEIPEPECYTQYSYPMQRDNGMVVAIKENLAHHAALVEIDSLGNERRITYLGQLSTRPAMSESGRLWWTEYRRSALFAEKVGSQLYYLDFDKERPRRVRKQTNVLYPTPVGEQGLAWMEYTMNGQYHLVTQDIEGAAPRTSLPLGKEVHGLAWDNQTGAFYAIITDDDGMHIARIDNDGAVAITRPAYTTLSDLRAKDGMLYFGSIASGRDELHCYDLNTQREYRVSESEFGSFSPMPTDNNTLLATSYAKNGYMPVRQELDSLIEVEYAPCPPQILLPHVRRWNVVNLDTVRLDSHKTDSIQQNTPPRRFSRIGHAFNIHSWAPASYNPFSLGEGISFNLGATIMSQNLLSNTEGFLTWGWNHREGSIFSGTIRYYGLGATLWVNGTYGGNQRLHRVYQYNPDTQKLEFPEEPKTGKYYAVNAGVTLPLLFEHGYHTRQLTTSATWQYTNGLVANVKGISFADGKISNIKTLGYTEGVHTLLFGVSYQDKVRMAHRDFLPPWAVSVAVDYALNPTNRDFGHLAMIYGKLYTPGFAPHHSLSVAASYQTSIGGFQQVNESTGESYVLSELSYKITRLLPRGFSSYDINSNHYVAASVNYHLPLWYPDGGISGFIYFKRLRLNVGADYASFNTGSFNTADGSAIHPRRHIFAYGADLSADINVLGMPASATLVVTLSAYMRHAPHDINHHNKPYISFGLGLPF